MMQMPRKTTVKLGSPNRVSRSRELFLFLVDMFQTFQTVWNSNKTTTACVFVVAESALARTQPQQQTIWTKVQYSWKSIHINRQNRHQMHQIEKKNFWIYVYWLSAIFLSGTFQKQQQKKYPQNAYATIWSVCLAICWVAYRVLVAEATLFTQQNCFAPLFQRSRNGTGSFLMTNCRLFAWKVHSPFRKIISRPAVKYFQWNVYKFMQLIWFEWANLMIYDYGPTNIF